MPIVANNLDDAIKDLDILQQRWEDAELLRLGQLGVKCVAMVRKATEEESWIDHTGNLRSSIGYIIARDGQVLQKSSFETILNGAEGAAQGESYARKLAAENNHGTVLIVVAGESYAEHVEAIEGKTVLAAAALFAESQLPKIIENLKRDISK